MNALHRLVLATLVLTTAVVTNVAHHSFAMFDSSREEVLTGEVVRWAFNSPHAALFVKDAKGVVWSFEGAGPPALVGRTPRITGLTFKPGDKITMIHCPLGDGRPGGAIGRIVTADGEWFNAADGGCRANEANWKPWLAAGYNSRAQAEAAAKK